MGALYKHRTSLALSNQCFISYPVTERAAHATKSSAVSVKFSYYYPGLSGLSEIRGGADKSLARPGRQQATATKLGIYSTYSPRSSIHFLAQCSNFWKPFKKKSQGCPSNQVSAAAMTASDEKWPPFTCFFSPANRL